MKDYKNLAETIYKRKSIRKYSRDPVEFLDKDIDLIKELDIKPLIDNIKVKVKILRKEEVKNDRSDYCIAFYSEEKPHNLENIGFIGQQVELALQFKGIGTCWWGMKKPKKEYKNIDGLSCIITMTAGYPKVKVERAYPEGFSRKANKEIFIGNLIPDNYSEVIRIAPSAVNLQPWLIEKTGNKFNFYLRPPKSLIEKMIKDMRQLDMGIAMAQFFIQVKADGKNVSFDFIGNDAKFGKFVASAVVS